jgi:hypothetical protein
LINYTYKFEFSDGKVKTFQVKLKENPLRLYRQKPFADNLPEWVKLSFQQCPNCPLTKEHTKYCPVSASLLNIIDFFKNYNSYERVNLTIETKERSFNKLTSLQKGISSIIGIYMVTAGCPLLAKLKPMVRFHLPFADLKETRYRVLSMYLLGQYFKKQNGQDPDWELTSLTDLYEEIKIVNKSLCARLSKISKKDANLNALVQLDTFAETILFSVGRNNMDSLETLFEDYY